MPSKSKEKRARKATGEDEGMQKVKAVEAVKLYYPMHELKCIKSTMVKCLTNVKLALMTT